MTKITRNLDELAEGEIVPQMSGDNQWLVRFGEDDYDYVPKSPKNRLLLEGRFDTTGSETYNGITVNYDLEADSLELDNGSETVRVPYEKHQNVLWSLYDEDGTRLEKLYKELYTPTVRQGLLDQIMPRFRQNDEIQKRNDGWLVNGDVIVRWDASNVVAGVDETHQRNGDTTTITNETKPAFEVDYRLDGNTVQFPDGREFSLEDVEMKFLITVSKALDRNPSMYDDDLYTAIEDSRVVGFTAPTSGLYHSHGMEKHDASDLGVTDEAIEKLWTESNDHGAVWELSVREDEFKNAPFDVFEDAENDNSEKWEKIHRTKDKAPIPSDFHRKLQERFD